MRRLAVLLLILINVTWLPAATSRQKTTTTHHNKVPTKKVALAVKSTTSTKTATKTATKTTTSSAHPGKASSLSSTPRRGPWRVPTYANSTEGDVNTGEDLGARRAAVEALGNLNGTVVVADPETGRILTIVNQKLALRDGYQPCSTVKVPVALAALSESIVERTTPMRVWGHTPLTLTEALAISNNQYFANLGEKLGFERVRYYAKMFGLGEKAGLDIEGEQAGLLTPAPPRNGVGMMTSFGDGISLTPLELTALVGAVANGGTLYYLQYPRSEQEIANLVPRVKRHLDIEPLIPEIMPGMAGAVEYGTARRIGFDASEPIYGKTGTCTDSRSPTHLGWFGSFIDKGGERLVVTVLLTGAQGVSGPAAAGVAGNVYKNLDSVHYFANRKRELSPLALIEPLHDTAAPKRVPLAPR